jgi:hypothetical protein
MYDMSQAMQCSLSHGRRGMFSALINIHMNSMLQHGIFSTGGFKDSKQLLQCATLLHFVTATL